MTGASDQQIARRLHVGAQPVKIHVSHILRKLDVASRIGAAAPARRDGIRPPPGVG